VFAVVSMFQFFGMASLSQSLLNYDSIKVWFCTHLFQTIFVIDVALVQQTGGEALGEDF
jgi:hypothetical protein